jgi:hypothetical protein
VNGSNYNAVVRSKEALAVLLEMNCLKEESCLKLTNHHFINDDLAGKEKW